MSVHRDDRAYVSARPIRTWAALLFAATLLLPAGGAQAVTTITVTDATSTLRADRAACTGYVDSIRYRNCASTAAISTTVLAGNDAEFKKSFDAWNAGITDNDAKWTLINGGALPGGNFRVSIFDA